MKPSIYLSLYTFRLVRIWAYKMSVLGYIAGISLAMYSVMWDRAWAGGYITLSVTRRCGQAHRLPQPTRAIPLTSRQALKWRGGGSGGWWWWWVVDYWVEGGDINCVSMCVFGVGGLFILTPFLPPDRVAAFPSYLLFNALLNLINQVHVVIQFKRKQLHFLLKQQKIRVTGCPCRFPLLRGSSLLFSHTKEKH